MILVASIFSIRIGYIRGHHFVQETLASSIIQEPAVEFVAISKVVPLLD